MANRKIIIRIPENKYDGLMRQMKLDRNFRECEIIELGDEDAQSDKGQWILSGGYWRCSKCKEKALLKLDRSKGNCKEYMPIKSDFCPNCGKKMIEPNIKVSP